MPAFSICRLRDIGERSLAGIGLTCSADIVPVLSQGSESLREPDRADRRRAYPSESKPAVQPELSRASDLN